GRRRIRRRADERRNDAARVRGGDRVARHGRARRGAPVTLHERTPRLAERLEKRVVEVGGPRTVDAAARAGTAARPGDPVDVGAPPMLERALATAAGVKSRA